MLVADLPSFLFAKPHGMIKPSQEPKLEVPTIYKPYVRAM